MHDEINKINNLDYENQILHNNQKYM